MRFINFHQWQTGWIWDVILSFVVSIYQVLTNSKPEGCIFWLTFSHFSIIFPHFVVTWKTQKQRLDLKKKKKEEKCQNYPIKTYFVRVEQLLKIQSVVFKFFLLSRRFLCFLCLCSIKWANLNDKRGNNSFVALHFFFPSSVRPIFLIHSFMFLSAHSFNVKRKVLQ